MSAIAERARVSGSLFGFSRHQGVAFLLMAVLVVLSPTVLYPIFVMKVLCYALFAFAFNLLIGFVGLRASATPPISAWAATSLPTPPRPGAGPPRSPSSPAG
jgi:hypothetical protein